ncbi:MAG: nucleotidyltransferase family protein [Phycisphaerales bacterium]
MTTGPDDIAALMATNLSRLRTRFGVSGMALFGSCARGEATPTSDADVLVTFQSGARVTLLTLAALKRDLEKLLGRSVDLVEDHPRLPESLRREIEKDLRRVA